jgi:hypothetical protein
MIELKFTGSTMDVIRQSVLDAFPPPTPAQELQEMTLQEVIAIASAMAEKTGYEVTLGKKGKTVSEQKKEEARAKLRGDLVESLKVEGKSEVPSSPEPVSPPVSPANGSAELPPPAQTKSAGPSPKAAVKAEDPAARKTRCIEAMKKLYKTNKAEIDKLALKYADGDTRRFALLPDGTFEAIAKDLEAVS